MKQANKGTDYEDTLTGDEDTQDVLKISNMLINKQQKLVYLKFYYY